MRSPGSYRDVTEWENRYVAATDEAQQYADLLSAISHDVRTPRDRDRGLVELLRTQPIDERTRQMVDSVRQSAASLTTMLDDFMDAARADAGRLDIRAEEANPESLLESVTDMVAPIARAKGLLPQSAVAPRRCRRGPARHRPGAPGAAQSGLERGQFASAGHVLLIATVRRDSDGDRLVVACEDTGPGLGDPSPDESLHCFCAGPQEDGGQRRAPDWGCRSPPDQRRRWEAVWLSPRRGHRSTFRFELPLVARARGGHRQRTDVVRGSSDQRRQRPLRP